MIETKYTSIATRPLVVAIQRSHLEIIDKHWKTKMSERRYKQIKNELAEMRVEVIERLTHMDRTKKEFFPLGAHITYSPNEDYPPRRGIVISYGDLNTLIVALEHDSFYTEVIPTNCSLLFIRNSLL